MILLSGHLKTPSIFGDAFMALFWMHIIAFCAMKLQYYFQRNAHYFMLGSFFELIYMLLIPGAYLYVQVILWANSDIHSCFHKFAIELTWILLDVSTYYMYILVPMFMLLCGFIHSFRSSSHLLEQPINHCKDVFGQRYSEECLNQFNNTVISTVLFFLTFTNYNTSTFLWVVMGVNAFLHILQSGPYFAHLIEKTDHKKKEAMTE